MSSEKKPWFFNGHLVDNIFYNTITERYVIYSGKYVVATISDPVIGDDGEIVRDYDALGEIFGDNEENIGSGQ